MSVRMIAHLVRILCNHNIPDEMKVITILKAFSNDGLPMAKILSDHWHMSQEYPIQQMTYDAKNDVITYVYKRG